MNLEAFYAAEGRAASRMMIHYLDDAPVAEVVELLPRIDVARLSDMHLTCLVCALHMPRSQPFRDELGRRGRNDILRAVNT